MAAGEARDGEAGRAAIEHVVALRVVRRARCCEMRHRAQIPACEQHFLKACRTGGLTRYGARIAVSRLGASAQPLQSGCGRAIALEPCGERRKRVENEDVPIARRTENA